MPRYRKGGNVSLQGHCLQCGDEIPDSYTYCESGNNCYGSMEYILIDAGWSLRDHWASCAKSNCSVCDKILESREWLKALISQEEALEAQNDSEDESVPF